jgi:tetratricopeptide (TPR) repeat protein
LVITYGASCAARQSSSQYRGYVLRQVADKKGGDYKEAIAKFEKAIELDPNLEDAYRALAAKWPVTW